MIVNIHFDLSDDFERDLGITTISEYDNYLNDEFGLNVIDECDIHYLVTDASKFSIFLLKYPNHIIDITEE